MTNDIKMPLKSKIIEMNYKGYKYSIEHFYYEDKDGKKYTTTELDSDFYDRLEQLHRDRKISEILKKD
jgi:hypothetical protein